MIVRYSRHYQAFKHSTVLDDENNTVEVLGEPFEIKAYIYPASGQVQAQQYGNELGYVLNCLTHDDRLKELDVISVYDDKDYSVISVKVYSGHYLLELKKR